MMATKSKKNNFLILFIGINVCFMLFYFVYYKSENPTILSKAVDNTKQQMQDIESIITKYMHRLKQNPDDIEALKNLGRIFMRMRAWDKASFFWERAESVYPNDKDVLINLATCYLFLKKYNDASIYLNRYLKIDPKNYMAKFNLAYLYGFILNKKNKARKLFSEMLLDKDLPDNIKQKVKESLNELNNK